MAEAFLNQLLRVENSVQNSGESCIICLTECGTLDPRTGVVEWEIRLPCNHTVGSSCIATWLNPTGAARNSCPLCRFIFFPAQSRPYLEHGIFEGDQNNRISSDGSNLPGVGNWLADAIRYLNYSGPTYTARTFDREDWEIEGANLVNGNGDEEADEETNSEDISSAPPVISEHSQSPRRSARLRGIAPEPLEQESTPSPSARQQGLPQNDGEELQFEDSDDEDLDSGTLKLMCETYSYRLNLNLTPNSRAIETSQRIAERTSAAYRPFDHGLQSCAAVAVYVASHLAGAPKTPHTVSMMSGVGSGIISAFYLSIFTERVRTGLLDEDMLAMINRGDRETVLGFMPVPFSPL